MSSVKHDNTRRVSAKAPKVINGKPYYPSVEEVMALLHADRADVIERVTSGDSQPRDRHDDIIEPTDIAAEQREQEKLRSEVVGRIEPKLAFTDEAVTSGVLPTTIRRNSLSGSLSSIDSLDAVPDEPLEAMPASSGSPIAGIIRKGNKVKRDSRVTFNENVAFSDGVVGTLKRKQGNESVLDSSIMPKQRSYFELFDSNTSFSEGKGNESKPKVNGTGLESSKDSLIMNHYLPRQSKSNIPMSSAQNYPHVNASDIGTTGVMTYSAGGNSMATMASNNSRQTGGNLTPTVTVTTPELKANALHVLPNSPRVNGLSHVGHTNQMTASQAGSTSKNNGSEQDNTRKMESDREGVNNKIYVGYTSQMTGSQTSSAPLQLRNGVKSKTFVNGGTSDHTHSHNNGNMKCNDRPSVPFSSINASMLKDSLEMHDDIRVSQSDSNIPQVSTEAQGPRVGTRPPNSENPSSGYITKHAEIPPETPLIPVTKRDFLSKALRSDGKGVSDVNINSISDHTRNHPRKEEMAVDGRIESTTNRNSGGKSFPRTEQEASIGGYSMYSQERDVPQNRETIPEQSENKRLTENGIDRTGQSLYENDSYNQKQTVPNSSAMRDNMVSSPYNSDRTKQKVHDDSYSQRHAVDSRGVRDNTGSSSTSGGIPYYGSSLNQGHQLISRDNHGIPRPNRTTGESSSAIPPRSRTEPTEKLTTTQNTLGTTNTVNQPSYRPTLTNGEQNFASRKPSSADELLKSVQENIERLSMTPSQQGISRTSSSGVKPTGPFSARPYKTTTSESRHNRNYSDNGRRPKDYDKGDTSPSSQSKGSPKSTAIGRERKVSNRKPPSNGQKSKLGEARKVNGNNKRFQRSGSDSGIANQRSGINMGHGATQNNNHETTTNTNTTYTSNSRVQSAHPNQVYTSPNYKTDYHSAAYQSNNRLYGVPSEPRGLHPQSNAFERKQRKNSEGLAFLDKTPTDEEINHLWETVRTCLKHEQPQKAASDSIVNNVRYSRSDSGPLVGNHYLIDGNAWASKPIGGSDNETRYSRGTASSHFCRQGSLDSLQRRGSAESAGYMPLRKGSLLQHRTSTSERRLTSRNSQAGRPPVNPQYLHSFRGPMTSSRGPVKSNTVKTEGRPPLSYAEFQAVMQASADIKTRNTEGDTQKNSRQNVHQPIIMNYRKGKMGK